MIVEENFANPITIEQLAYLSWPQRCRVLNATSTDIYNMPPSEWIRVKRSEQSKGQHLKTPDLPVVDVCYMVGFEKPFSFLPDL